MHEYLRSQDRATVLSYMRTKDCIRFLNSSEFYEVASVVSLMNDTRRLEILQKLYKHNGFVRTDIHTALCEREEFLEQQRARNQIKWPPHSITGDRAGKNRRSTYPECRECLQIIQEGYSIIGGNCTIHPFHDYYMDLKTRHCRFCEEGVTN